MRKADAPYYKNAGLMAGKNVVKNAMDTVRSSMPKIPAMPAMPSQTPPAAQTAVGMAKGMGDKIVSKVQKRVGGMDKSIAGREGFGSQIGRTPRMPRKPRV